ncbi:CG33713, partial [Drosophila busckii]
EDEQLAKLTQRFKLATEHIAAQSAKYDAQHLLVFYGLFKQATVGYCREPRPSLLQVKARNKWTAWHTLGKMPKVAAQRSYVDKLTKINPNWEPGDQRVGRLSGWVVHSIEAPPKDAETPPEHLKTLCDFVKEHNLQRLRQKLKPKDITTLDEQGMSLLHWAADRNAVAIIEFLVSSGASVNQRDAEKQTPLHYAASCGHVEALKCLLRLKADLSLCDSDGQSCLDVADGEPVCEILR